MKVDDVEIAKQQAIRGRPLSEQQKSLLIDAGLDDFVRGGQTQSPMGDLAILGATAAAVKGLPALAANEVSKMTISDAAFKKGLLPQLTKGGIKNWQHLRPWKAFTPQMLKTGPTPAAAGALGLMIEGTGAPAAKGQPPPLPPIPGAIQELQVQPFKGKKESEFPELSKKEKLEWTKRAQLDAKEGKPAYADWWRQKGPQGTRNFTDIPDDQVPDYTTDDSIKTIKWSDYYNKEEE